MPPLLDYNFGSEDPDHKWSPFAWDLSQLPSSKSLLDYDSGIQDQLQFGSCVANAWAKALEIELRENGVSADLSREFIYYDARFDTVGDPTKVTDSGSSAWVAAADIATRGVPTENLWPYLTDTINQMPSAAAYADAATRLMGPYERIGNSTADVYTGNSITRDFVGDVKVALNCGMPVVVCMALTDSFRNIHGPLSTHESQYNPVQFIYPTTPGFIGYHCMTVVGYDDSMGGFILENSWGSNWGDNGLVFMSYQSLAAVQYDAFVARSFDGFEFNIPDSYYVWNAHELSRVVSHDFDGIPGEIYRLYQAAFSRHPDWDGLGYHIYYAMHGESLVQIAGNFIDSPEYQAFMQRWGVTDNRSFVRELYLTALYREPDPGGWDYHTNLLDSGVLTRAQVLLNFSESPENKANCLFIYHDEGIDYYPYAPANLVGVSTSVQHDIVHCIC